VLEQALWRRLTEARSLDEVAPVWLSIQCGLLPAANCAAILISMPGGERRAIGKWPDDAVEVSRLAPTADMAITERRGVIRKLGAANGTAGGGAQLAYPLVIDDTIHGAVVVEIQTETALHLRSAIRQLEWGTAWIRERLRQRAADDALRSFTRVSGALDVMSVALDEEGFASACRACVTELAVAQSCERVSLGFVRGGRVRVVAVSHSTQFGKQMNLIRTLESAMDEAIDQRAVILYPRRQDEVHVTRAHAALAEAHGSGAILTTPVFVKDEFVGAFSFERHKDLPFDQETIDFLECVASALGPILDIKRQNDRWLAVKAIHSLRAQAKRLLGPGYVGRKLAAAAVIATFVIGYFATDTYRVTANATVEGKIQRAMVAPYNGFIKDAPVRAGDAVNPGDLVLALDDRDLALERLRWVTERQKKLFEYERALGSRERADARISQKEIEEADAQIKLVDEQLARSKLHAPFSGLVVSGDFSQSIGAAVQRGQQLFEIAPLNSYRVVLDVDESQIGDVVVGSPAELVVASLPNETFALVLEKITPVAKAEEGANTFRVEASLRHISPRLRPGMKGVGKIEIERRPVVWIWTRTLIHWGRLAAWRWLN
jgi:RND family efflux transporter MFP subunit